MRSGRSGREQSAVGAERVRAWLDHFEAVGNGRVQLRALFPDRPQGALRALCAGARRRHCRARRQGDRAASEIVARSAHHGILTGAQGRSYEHTLRAARSLELSGICRMLWGKGILRHALPRAAAAGALPARSWAFVSGRAWRHRFAYRATTREEWSSRRAQDRFARLYHYKTRDYAMGSAAAYRWDQWGYQETVLHFRHRREPRRAMLDQPSGRGAAVGLWPAVLLGRLRHVAARAPVSRRWRSLRFTCFEEQPDFTHAWFPRCAFDASRVGAHAALAEAGDAFVLVKTDAPLAEVDERPHGRLRAARGRAPRDLDRAARRPRRACLARRVRRGIFGIVGAGGR